jgi:hypothetical protein
MNLKNSNGKVPIRNRRADTPWILIDFPSFEVFQTLYEKSHTPASAAKIWEIVRSRAAGATLEDAVKPYGLTKERARQIEAKFLRRMTDYYWKTKDRLSD